MNHKNLFLNILQKGFILAFCNLSLLTLLGEEEKNTPNKSVISHGFSNLGLIEEINFNAETKSSSESISTTQSQAPAVPAQSRAVPTAKQSSARQPQRARSPAPAYVQPPAPISPPTRPVAVQNQVPKPPPPIGAENSPYAFHAFRLSYMQSDRVLALLKSVGYSTVEYSATRGESLTENIFSALAYAAKYPIVVKMLDSSKTSLMQPALDGGRSATGMDRLGGTYLHSSTTGAPEQRLLIIYEKQYPEQLNGLLNLLRNQVDVPARQIVIEALVVEINTKKAQDLGFKYNLVDNKTVTNLDTQSGVTSQFRSDESSYFDINSRFNGNYYNDASTGLVTPFKANVWSRSVPLGFTATLDAFISDGTANVLSNPTILVLDGRQALIRIGTQFPYQQISVNPVGADRITYQYANTGIVLNIRPRISEDGSEVTMQTETIVSSAIPNPNPIIPPEIENKTVQSFVRVADNTPFIIGGLIDKKKQDGYTGVPFLSKIPVLGNLFKSKSESTSDREVIIVLTPHIMDANEKSFSYVIPKDSETFDSFDNVLFRNAYRIRDEDLFDLSFATQSEFYNNILDELREYKKTHPEIPENDPLFSYLKDKVPGEEVIVRRLIWEIVHKSKFHQHIADDHILLFEDNEEAKFGNKFKTHLLSSLLSRITEKTDNSLVFNLADHKEKSAGPFEHPRAIISTDQVTDSSSYIERMSLLNAEDENRNHLLLCPGVSPPGVRGATALDVLKGVLVLKRILKLNHTMPVTINEFRVGRQITFPTEQELKDKYHVVDYDTARFFYEVINYYPEFEQAFNRDSASIIFKMRGVEN
jgi:Flp pilus assembly secretin CpaC